MPFRSYDTLRVFTVVARHESVTAAAQELNLSKASVSYQIRKLEDELGFTVFDRKGQRLHISPKGEKLMHSAQLAFGQLDRGIRELKEAAPEMITIGALTYFFSRWLSSRLAEDIEAWVTARTSRAGSANRWPMRSSKALRSPLSFISPL